MRVKGVTIPSGFQLLDSHISDSDEVANVRDQHVLRQNHNILTAKRIRKEIVHQSLGAPAPGYSPAFYSRWPVGASLSRIFSIPLQLTQLTNEIQFWMYANKTALLGGSTLGDNPEVHLTLHEPQVSSFASESFEVTSFTQALYAKTVSVPPQAGERTMQYGRMPYVLDVHLRCYIDDTNSVATGVAVVESDARSVVALNGYGNDRALIFGNTIRQPTATNSYTGGDNKTYFDEPLVDIPDPGTDTFDVRQILGIEVQSFGVYEEYISTFDEEHQEATSSGGWTP